MRIISGKYKGRNIIGFNIEGTRPTMDRVKESLFAMLQLKLKDSICLDLFAGSGNLGLEALSNGAKECYFVDNNKIATSTITKNIINIKVDESIKIINDDYKNAIIKMSNDNIKFDLIFLDPPYNSNLIDESLTAIRENQLLNKDGYVICEFEGENINTANYTILKEKKYGPKRILILKETH